MPTFPKTPEQKFILISGILVVLAGFVLFNANHEYNSVTFVDAVPPEEFMTSAADTAQAAGDRRPSNAPLTAPQILKARKKFETLSRPEKRSLYNAVMYYCNEERDDRVCDAYVNHCGKPCQMLVQASPGR
jgi:hypothetical protein